MPVEHRCRQRLSKPQVLHWLLHAKCERCQHMKCVLAVRPTSGKWNCKLGDATLAVKRFQFPLAPAQAKTCHSIQGSTCDPGMVGHFTTPPQLGESSVWLTVYVLLSRVRNLRSLLSTDLPSRTFFERGPPQELRSRIDSMFQQRVEQTVDTCKAARKFLGWPARSA